MMDYEQDEQEEQFEEQAAEPQAEDMEIDEDDAPYLDLQDDRERQAYIMIKNWSFGHTRTFDPDLLEKIVMDGDFARVWHAVGWDGFCARWGEWFSSPHHPVSLHSSGGGRWCFFPTFWSWTLF